MQRLAFGALAGLSATMAMTTAMRHLWPLLEPRNRYPLPPREIISRLTTPSTESGARLSSVLAHFGFGAFAGALYASLPQRMSGMLFGVAVWAGSYLGWLPALGILKPATRHPPERNLLMLAVHLVWGLTLAGSLRELEGSADGIFAGGRHQDVRGEWPRGRKS